MLARLRRLKTTEEQYEAGLRLVREDLLPWARESDGYCGALGLVNRETAGRSSSRCGRTARRRGRRARRRRNA